MKKLAFLVLFLLILPTFPTARAETDSDLKIKEVYYNTGPECEFITLKNRGDGKNFEKVTLTDGENELHLPEFRLNESERLVISEDHRYEDLWNKKPDFVWTDEASDEIDGRLTLPDEGGKVILKSDGENIDSFYYGDIDPKGGWVGNSTEKLPKGAYARRKGRDTDSREDWNHTRRWMVGHSDFEPEKLDYEGKAVAFTSPDNSFRSIMSFLDDVDSSLQISIYKLSDLRMARKIANLSKRGVEVRILVEGEPVNGISKRSKRSLNLIKENGGEVRLFGRNGYAPYRYLHSKYMIKDRESLLITTENLVRSGFPSSKDFGNRGWGAILKSKTAASYYKRVFDHDWNYTKEFEGESVEIEKTRYEEGHHFPRFDREVIDGELEVRPVLSPDTSTSESTVLELIENARDSIYVQQYYIQHYEEGKNPYLRAIKKAAKRGVEVKVLLDSSYYHREKNNGMKRELNRFAKNNELKIEARLLSNYKGLTKSHTKGMVVDGKKVLISSINWNSNSMLLNREAGIIIENNDIGDYFSKIFLQDWRDHIEPIADAGKNRTVKAGKQVLLSGKDCWDDHESIKYKWDIDDDGAFEKEGKNVKLEFDKRETRKITLKVEDVGGNIDEDTFRLKIKKEEEAIDWGKLASWVFLAFPMIAITLFLLHSTLINRS